MAPLIVRRPTGHRRSRATVAVTLLLVLVASLVAGCGSEEASTLDRPATETAIGKVVAQRVGARARNTACPKEIPRGKGERIDCTVTLAKLGAVRVRVRQVDDEGRLDVVIRDAIVDNAAVTKALKSQLKATFSRSFQADCGTGRRVVTPGRAFRCKARDRNGRRVVLVTVKDAAGTLSFRVLS